MARGESKTVNGKGRKARTQAYEQDHPRIERRTCVAHRERVQAYEGVVIAKKNRGLNSSFTVRKISHGEGVERVFQTFSPAISEVSVKRRGAVRRAKLYYLRDLSGKAARIDEKI